MRKVLVPEGFPHGYATFLQSRGVVVEVKLPPFFEARAVKTPKELACIRSCAEAACQAFSLVREMLTTATIGEGVLKLSDKPLTARRLQEELARFLFFRGFTSPKLIVAAGRASVNPHASSSGPLRQGLPIVVDICLRSLESHYWADMSRTFVKGAASGKIRRMHEAVLEAQRISASLVRDGMDAQTVHQSVVEHFLFRGFPTRLVRGRMQGFFRVPRDMVSGSRCTSPRGWDGVLNAW